MPTQVFLCALTTHHFRVLETGFATARYGFMTVPKKLFATVLLLDSDAYTKLNSVQMLGF